MTTPVGPVRNLMTEGAIPVLELIPFSTATYWMNYAAHNAACAGASMGDIACAIRPYLAHVEANRAVFEQAKRHAPLRFDGKPATVPPELIPVLLEGNPIWCDGWLAEGERLAAIADSFLARGHGLTAGGIYRRASVLVSYAEWTMLLSPRKRAAYDRGRDLAIKAMGLLGERFEPVKIPYGDTELSPCRTITSATGMPSSSCATCASVVSRPWP